MNPSAAIPFVNGIVCLGLLALATTWGRGRVGRCYSLVLIVSAVWATGAVLQYTGVGAVHAVAEAAAPAVQLSVALSYYVFVRACDNRKTDRHIKVGILAVLGLGIVAALPAPILATAAPEFLSAAGNPAATVASVLTFYLVLRAASALGLHYRKLNDAAARARTLHLLAGMCLVAGCNAIQLSGAVAWVAWEHLGNTVFCLFGGYAVLRPRFPEIRLALARVVLLTAVSVAMASTYLAIVRLLTHGLVNDDLTAGLIAALPTLVVGLAMLGPLSVSRIGFFERQSSRAQSAAAVLASQANDGNNASLGMERVARSLLDLVAKAVGATDAALLLVRDDGTGCELAARLRDNGPPPPLRLSLSNPIITYLVRVGEPVFRRELSNTGQLRGAWDEDMRWLSELRGELLCPLVDNQKLIGVLVFGPKHSAYSYTSDDLAALVACANEVAALLANARRHQDIEVQASTDELTGLLNHRLFYQTLETQIQRASRSGASFALLMIDLDLFKPYNDTHGHLAGDAMLREVARCVATSIRHVDLAFRYGGEEFAVVIPHADESVGLKVAERIRRAVESSMEARGAWLTVSAGVAAWPADAVIGSELVHCADSALYDAKHGGRNCTRLHSAIKPRAPEEVSHVARADGGISLVYALAATVDAKDHFTYGHSKKVSKYAVAVGEKMGLSRDRVAVLRDSGLLHDIGKISVPDALLRKDGPLSPQEWTQMRGHPEVAVAILRYAEGLGDCLPAILHHHERYDGSGYPLGLAGKSIPIEARIVAVADTYDAMTSDRPYRKALSPERALDELVSCAGRQFDPEVVAAFADLIKASSPQLSRIHAEMARA